ncbi:MAG: hypothetical protein DRN15_09275 [Thermoprotei archaeon]|nr:MAG: hypothetical protein DRN15_09275 [Thermoprotei archaeon]
MRSLGHYKHLYMYEILPIYKYLLLSRGMRVSKRNTESSKYWLWRVKPIAYLLVNILPFSSFPAILILKLGRRVLFCPLIDIHCFRLP